VTEGAACTAGDPRCMMGEDLCVCFVEDGSVWDCDDQPSFWE
jgi:hypothetical protein